jgi:hypothetical protein
VKRQARRRPTECRSQLVEDSDQPLEVLAVARVGDVDVERSERRAIRPTCDAADQDEIDATVPESREQRDRIERVRL